MFFHYNVSIFFMNSNKASLDLHLHQSEWENSIVALFYAHPNNEGTMSDEIVCTAYAGDQMVYYLHENIRFESG